MTVWDESVTNGRDGQEPVNPGSPAGSLAAFLVAEIRSIRKGRGVWAANFDQRLGPQLRELAADRTGEDTDSRRQAFVAVMQAASARLPEDLRTATEASLALSAETLTGLEPVTPTLPCGATASCWATAKRSRQPSQLYRQTVARINLVWIMLAISEVGCGRGRGWCGLTDPLYRPSGLAATVAAAVAS